MRSKYKLMTPAQVEISRRKLAYRYSSHVDCALLAMVVGFVITILFGVLAPELQIFAYIIIFAFFSLLTFLVYQPYIGDEFEPIDCLDKVKILQDMAADCPAVDDLLKEIVGQGNSVFLNRDYLEARKRYLAHQNLAKAEEHALQAAQQEARAREEMEKLAVSLSSQTRP